MTLKGIYSSSSSVTKLVIFLFIFLFSTFVISLVFLILGVSVLNINVIETASLQEIFTFKILQAVQALFVFVIPSLFTAYLFGKKSVSRYFIKNKQSFKLFILVFFLVVFTMPIMNIIGQLNSQIPLPEWLCWMEESETKLNIVTNVLLRANSINGLLLNLIVIALIPAVGEELLFRGVLQKILLEIRKKPHIAIWLTAFVFSVIHFQFLTFFPRFLLGAILGYLMVWSRSIIVPIFAHFTNNGLAVLLSYFVQNNYVSKQVESIGTKSNQVYYFLFFGLLSVLIIYKIYKVSETKIK